MPAHWLFLAFIAAMTTSPEFTWTGRPEIDLREPRHPLVSVIGGPPHGIALERDKLDKYGRPLLGGTIKPKIGLSARNYGRSGYELLRGGLEVLPATAIVDRRAAVSQPWSVSDRPAAPLFR